MVTFSGTLFSFGFGSSSTGCCEDFLVLTSLGVGFGDFAFSLLFDCEFLDGGFSSIFIADTDDGVTLCCAGTS